MDRLAFANLERDAHAAISILQRGDNRVNASGEIPVPTIEDAEAPDVQPELIAVQAPFLPNDPQVASRKVGRRGRNTQREVAGTENFVSVKLQGTNFALTWITLCALRPRRWRDEQDCGCQYEASTRGVQMAYPAGACLIDGGPCAA